ncbi:MAG: 4-(cytidine 5'-diphospho)-2-C-methyl-D-erythritol kinase [Gammaproteobacteria bacterium]|nr:4-(cytidine 5'-diphospho)-2-C-methyl-D-erythritol kinase [Gammaproteobacteria bacterium]
MHAVIQNWPAPAKINLFLHITGRREDGYHLLQTAFQFLDFCDQLQFQIREDGQIRRLTDIPAIPAESDLCVRAARLLQQVSGVSRGVDIEVLKRIPTGGGLGGGSSDAATTLQALNSLWQIGFDSDRLAELGVQLGADVPVFVHGLAAWAEGVGEILQPLELEQPWYLLILPPVHVSTAEVFNAPDLTRMCPAIKIRDLAEGRTSNVCEPVVRKLYPPVDQALRWLTRYTEARMTGTGACVFGRFNSKTEADAVCSKFEQTMPPSWQAYVCKGMNRSPLLDAINSYRSGGNIIASPTGRG